MTEAERTERTPEDSLPPILTWTLRLRNRPGALERVLSVLRRRLVSVEALSVARAPDEILEVEMHVSVESSRQERVEAELAGLADVETWARSNP